MTDRQKEILIHALGVDKSRDGKPYRNHFNASMGGDGFNECRSLVEMGLMEQGRPVVGGSVFFHLTAQGVQAVMGLATPMADIEVFIQTGDWPKKRRRARA